MNTSLRHVGIVVHDIELCKKFWIETMGYHVELEALEQGPILDAVIGLDDIEVTTSKLRHADGSMIELLKFHSHSSQQSWNGSPVQTGITHLAYTVDNLDQLYQNRASNGLRFNNPPQTSPDGKVKVCYCRGPESLILELVQPLKL